MTSPWILNDMPVHIAIAVNGYPFFVLVGMKVAVRSKEQIVKIVKTSIEKIKEEMNEELYKSTFRKFLVVSERCPIYPLSIPALDVPELST